MRPVVSRVGHPFAALLLAMAACGGESPTPPPEKSAPELTSITVSCAPASVTTGTQSQCTASAKDQTGAAFTVSAFTWQSSDQARATVSSSGVVTTLGAGSVSISAGASAGGRTASGSATVTITAPPVTTHSGTISASETWRAADNPHVVDGILWVKGASSPVLTIEAGVEIRMRSGAAINVGEGTVGGSIRALGTAALPIRFVSSAATPAKGFWRLLVLADPTAQSELHHVSMSGCGASGGLPGACVRIANGARPLVDNVTVLGSSAYGVYVEDGAFAAGSTKLGVSGTDGHAMFVPANAAGSIPTGGTLSGNASNVIEVKGDVSSTQTWPNVGVPYFINDYVDVQGPSSPILTIASGAELRFGNGLALTVGVDAPGGLVTAGTAAAPVRFTHHASSPAPGGWRGIHFHPLTQSSSLTHTVVEYAGASGSGGLGNVNVYGSGSGSGARPVLTSVTLRHGSAMGVFLDGDGAFGAGSADLTIASNGTYPISIQAEHASSIPTATMTGNGSNVVEIRGGPVTRTQTWPRIAVPYFINSYLHVKGPAAPVLTLLPGTELRFGSVRTLDVGAGPGEDKSGGLVAIGTAEEPIRFTAHASSPTAGFWRGVHFHALREGSTRLDHVVVEYGGASGGLGEGNIVVESDRGAFITNARIRFSSSCGIDRTDPTGFKSFPTDFTAASLNNTFEGNARAAQCAVR